jgi:hypothetical protein
MLGPQAGYMLSAIRDRLRAGSADMVGCAVTFGRAGGCADTDALYALLHFAPSVPVVRVKKRRAAFPIVCGA